MSFWTVGDVATASKLNLMINHFKGASAPTSPTDGMIWIDDTDGDAQLMQTYSNGAWLLIGTINETAGTFSGAGGKIKQIVSTQDGIATTSASNIPSDDTTPQNTEGDEVMTLAITPTADDTKLLILVNLMVSASSSTQKITIALFQDSTADALAAVAYRTATTNQVVQQALHHNMVSGTASETTFKCRIGRSSAGNITFNGKPDQLYNGLAASTITIIEYET